MALLAKIIADLRKYSFMMIVTLVTAKALFSLYLQHQNDLPPQTGSGMTAVASGSTTNRQQDDLTFQTRFATALFTMLLIFALFVVDRYHEVLLWSAQHRAIALEKKLHMRLATWMNTQSKQLHVNSWGIGLYSCFIWSNFFAGVLTAIDLDHVWRIIQGKRDPDNCIRFLLWMLLLATLFWAWGYWYHRRTKGLSKGNKQQGKKNAGTVA
jgi:hypothetical protein